MKINLILFIILFNISSVFSQSDYTDTELIRLVESTVNNSLERLEKMGKLGEENINGLLLGTLHYSTELAGFNKVKNTIIYTDYQDDSLIISGILTNDVNWFGTGNAISNYTISEPEKFSLYMNIELKNKVPIKGSCFITRSESKQIEYTYEVLDSN